MFDFAFAWVDPPTNSFVSRFAPASVMTMMMSINLMVSNGVPNLTVGWLGRFYEPMGPAGFWWLNAALAGVGGMLALVLRPIIARLLCAHPEGRLEPAASTAF